MGRPVAALDRPRSTSPVRIGIVADTHLTRDERGTWKVLHRTERRLETAVRDLNAHGVTHVQFLGDLTHDGTRRSLGRFDAIVEELDAPFGVVPGNHDVPDDDDPDGLAFPAFVERFAPDGYPSATPVGDVTLVGLNSATLPDRSLRNSWRGAVSARQLERLDDLLARVPNPIVCVHHNLGPLPEHSPGTPWSWFAAANASDLVEILNDRDVLLAFSGHHHVPARVERGSTTEILAPATCSYPQAYLLLDVDERGTRVTIHPLATDDGLEEAIASARTDDPLGPTVLSIVDGRLADDALTRRSGDARPPE